MPSTTVIEATAKALHDRGVDTAFGLVGEDTVEIAVALAGLGTRYYATRHEAAAVSMAIGHGLATERAGVALLSCGPGLTNGLSQIVSASRSGGRVLVIVGTAETGVEEPIPPAPGSYPAYNKHIDQTAIVEAAGVVSATIASPETAYADVAAAYDRAAAGLTIVLNIPGGMLHEPAGDEPARITLPALSPPPPPAADEIGIVADLLQEDWACQRPVILAGAGAVSAGAGPALAELGELCGALMATSLRGRSLFRGNPYDIGISGTLATPLGAELLHASDLVLAFGASLNEFTTGRNDMFPKARVLHFDAKDTAFGTSPTPDLGVIGDARLAAEALVEELRRRGHTAGGYRGPDVARRLAEAEGVAESPADRSGPAGLDPRAVVRELERLLPQQRTVAIDSGHFWGWPTAHLTFPRPRDYVWQEGFACVGAAAGVALGLAVGQPDRLTALFIGDGGFMMTISDLDTAVRYKIPVVIVVINDQAFGAEMRFLDFKGLPNELVRAASPSFASLAESVGAAGLHVERLEDLERLPRLLAELDGPLVLDCRVDVTIEDDWVPFLYAGGKGAHSVAAAVEPA